MSETTTSNGVIHGTFRRWFEDGTLAEEVQMRAGVPDGIAWSFYPSGFLKAKVELRNGTPHAQTYWNDHEQRLQ